MKRWIVLLTGCLWHGPAPLYCNLAETSTTGSRVPPAALPTSNDPVCQADALWTCPWCSFSILRPEKDPGPRRLTHELEGLEHRPDQAHHQTGWLSTATVCAGAQRDLCQATLAEMSGFQAATWPLLGRRGRVKRLKLARWWFCKNCSARCRNVPEAKKHQCTFRSYVRDNRETELKTLAKLEKWVLARREVVA